MAGKKFGLVVASKVPGSYFALSEGEQEQPGQAVEQLMSRYEGKVDVMRRYWTSTFSAEVSDVFVLEADDPAQLHAFNQELRDALSQGGDPERFGVDVAIWLGINPDAS